MVNMYWPTELLFLVALVVGVRSLQRYGAPYNGPPVIPVVLEGGFLADTREVAAAKEYHLNVLAKHAKAGGGGQTSSPYLYQQKSFSQPYIYSPQPVFTQAQPYTHSLYQNTGNQRSAYHPAPVYEDSSRQSFEPEEDYVEGFAYTTGRPDPMVTPRILDNGFIAETPEVDAAKAEHFAAVARAKEMVTLAQQRAAQEKAARGYSDGAPMGYSRHPNKGHSSTDYTGYNNPEYRSDKGYSESEGASGGYSAEQPSAYSESDRRAAFSPIDDQDYFSEQAPLKDSRDYSAPRDPKGYASEPVAAKNSKGPSVAVVAPRNAKAKSVAPAPHRDTKDASPVRQSKPKDNAEVRSKDQKARLTNPVSSKSQKGLSKPESEYPIRDKILALAKSEKEKAFAEYEAEIEHKAKSTSTKSAQ